MIIGIVDQSITGIEQPLRPAEAAHIVHITLVPGASISFRQQTLAVAKAITANGFSFGLLPTGFPGKQPTPVLSLPAWLNSSVADGHKNADILPPSLA